MWATTSIESSGIQPGTPAGNAVATRESIVVMTDEAENAVLRPHDTGAWPHALRASLASRMAQISSAPELAERYFQMIQNSDYESLASPDDDGTELGLNAVLTFMDAVAANPKDVTSSNVKALQSAGVSDADIVRLSEINAFIAYQIRLVAGLAMLAGANK